MGILDWQFGKKQRTPTGDRQLVCSACFDVCSGDNAHVIPWWNPDVEDFITTYRCGRCWLSSLDETATKIVELDDDSRKKFCDFLRRHYAPDLADELLAMSLVDASATVESLLDKIRSQQIVLSP